jgi:glycogen debranching enzyme
MEVVSPFRTPVTVLVENQGRRVLKNGNTFAVLDAFGNAQAAGPAAEGLFFEDTRHVSRLVTSIDGIRPLLLSSAVTADNAMLLVDLTNPDLIEKGELRQATATLHLLSTIVLDEDALFTTVEIRNFGAASTRFEIALDFEADFADIFEVRGSRRPHRGTVLPARQGAEGTVLGYRGLDGVVRRTRLVFDPPPDTTTPLVQLGAYICRQATCSPFVRKCTASGTTIRHARLPAGRAFSCRSGAPWSAERKRHRFARTMRLSTNG